MKKRVMTVVVIWWAVATSSQAIWAAEQPAGRSPTERLRQLDRNRDGVLTTDELRNPKLFRVLDRDGDGRVTAEEARAAAGAGKAGAERPPLPTPDLANLSYGLHPLNVLDLWKAKPASRPAPLIVYIHGGGFVGGDKSTLARAALDKALADGASVMAINYRFREHAPIQDILRDTARAVQFARQEAERFAIDPRRIGAFGGSAGAGSSLWLAVHDDLANVNAKDPVLRQSSRLAAAACLNGQATYNLLEWDRLIFPVKPEWREPNEYRKFYHFKSEDDFETPAGHSVLADCSMISLITRDDPPLFLWCNMPDAPPKDRNHLLHHPKHAQLLGAAARKVGVPVELQLRTSQKADSNVQGQVASVEFLAKQLTRPATARRR